LKGVSANDESARKRCSGKTTKGSKYPMDSPCKRHGLVEFVTTLRLRSALEDLTDIPSPNLED